MDPETIDHEYGIATLEPTIEAVAGTYRTWHLTYTVGNLEIDDGGTLKVAANMTSDWGEPQFERPTEENYATVTTSGNATVTACFDEQGHVRPWKHIIRIDVADGALDAGDTVTLTLGDTSHESLGHQVQTFPETEFKLVVFVDPFGTGEFVQLRSPDPIPIVAGDINSLHAVVPSTATVDEPRQV